MTLPSERFLAIQNAEQFLVDLLNPKKTPKVPSEIRKRARRLLKHYPQGFYLEEMTRLWQNYRKSL